MLRSLLQLMWDFTIYPLSGLSVLADTHSSLQLIRDLTLFILYLLTQRRERTQKFIHEKANFGKAPTRGDCVASYVAWKYTIPNLFFRSREHLSWVLTSVESPQRRWLDVRLFGLAIRVVGLLVSMACSSNILTHHTSYPIDPNHNDL